MAYKFQLDDAIMSGTLVQEGATEVVGNLTSTAILSASSLTLGNAAFSVSAAGAIAGATSIDGSGDLTVGSITMAEFTVASNGNTDIDGTLNVEGVPTFQAGAVFSAGITTAGAIAGATTISGSGALTALSLEAYGLNAKSAGISNAGPIAGATTISGSGALTALSLEAYGLNAKSAGISNAGAIAGATTVSGSGLAQFGQVRSDGGLTMQGTDIISAAKAIANVTSIDASGDLTVGTVTMTGFSVDNDGDVTGKSFVSTSTISGSGAVTGGSFAADGNVEVGGNLSGSTNLLVGGTVRVDGVAQAAVDVAGDFVLFLDDTDQLVKKEAVGDFATDLAGTGLEQNSNTIRIAAAAAGNGLSGGGGSALALDLNELTAADINVANDSIAIVDADDGNASKKESIADLVTAIAGGGLTATNGVLSTQAGSVTVGADGGTLSEGYNYFTGTVSAAANLPAAPSVGDVVVVKAGNTTSGQNITINAQGSHLIDGDATNIHLESPFAAVTLVYVVANDWRIV